MTRIAIYARVACDDPSRPNAILDQILACSEHAVSKGWTCVAVEKDVRSSGATLERCGLSRIMAMSHHDVDAVIAVSLDRYARDTRLLTNFIENMRVRGVQVRVAPERPLENARIGGVQ